MVIDLAVLEAEGVFDTLRVNEDCGREGYLFMKEETLNNFISKGSECWKGVRTIL